MSHSRGRPRQSRRPSKCYEGCGHACRPKVSLQEPRQARKPQDLSSGAARRKSASANRSEALSSRPSITPYCKRRARFLRQPGALGSGRSSGSASSILSRAPFGSWTLAPSTCGSAPLVLERAWAEPTQPGGTLHFGDAPYAHITARAVRVLRDRKLNAPESGNARVKALRQVFGWALAEALVGIETNPAREVNYLKGRPGGFHSWTMEEVERYEQHHAIGTKARLAMALLLYSGQRRSDVVLLGKQHVRSGWLHFTQRENRSEQARHAPDSGLAGAAADH